ncbi:DNA mismatch repair protein MutS [Candidatus Woesearchaeota archaeon]|jgi:DNA mismatch repair protein MutS|nr:DNA mismatch repair protein MutS [Candidatus Woesearchaeota archaeon]MBT3538205.1 DNA mismatch repair protein MutS [Candidatus Woesearchaeota archaeon]MBT4698465.1 DNA mismatch repair protein MutS [Candidatus Woesearchaeota archaeon]MBT4716845.1 DNA mismatch repair protein MutS [Candidatus Woesearchaeota archaeon]MBT7105874.1 DNA mismatch repair protein MutS [Candidatus Woesearchaeota archaeon]
MSFPNQDKNTQSSTDSFLKNFVDKSNLTPAMRQFWSVKEQHPDCLVLFRMGDFYETFYDDAKTAARELEITLTSRGQGPRKAPLAGIPYHALEPYLAKLVKKGYKVAIVEQLEDPKKAKGLVKRGVTRIVTPGTIIESAMLDDKENNFLMSLYANEDQYAIALCDISTGEFYTLECSNTNKLLTQLARFNPKECIIPLTLKVNQELISMLNKTDMFINTYDDRHFRKDNAYIQLTRHFNTINLEGFGIEQNQLSICAAGGLISYLAETQMTRLQHVNKICKITTSDRMILDRSTLNNLEILKNIRDNSQKGTLISVLDKTKTSMGSRLIKKWIKEPLVNQEEIEQRHGAVEQLTKETMVRNEIIDLLKEVNDIERLICRVNFGNASPRDLISLRNSLELVPKLNNETNKLDSELMKELSNTKEEEASAIQRTISTITKAIKDDPPNSMKDGNVIKLEYNEDLEQLHNIKNNGKEFIKSLEEAEKSKTGIKNLKIGFNNVFGYFIEVSKSNYHLVPQHYIRKQTRVNSERYITEELKEQESLILGAQEKIQTLEQEIFLEIVNQISENTETIQRTANRIAIVDTLVSFAIIALENRYSKPEIRETKHLNIINSRHPVIEQIEENFVPNNLKLNDGEMMIITGPNMAGKSTYMRQIALIVLMAQIGSFVPAEIAEIGIVDRIFTRVGAHDDLFTGQSTFMVEMNETANIINNATEKSLVILDEIGRGTSTFDGVSIAWSVAEHIHQDIKAKTLFATHYHVLNQLSDKHDKIKNYNIAVKETEEDIIFLRQIMEGGTDKSYGIHVAKLAGMPQEVVDRARNIQKKLESEDNMTHKINNQ